MSWGTPGKRFTESDITYDANGNMISDGRKNLQIGYNFLNLTGVVRGSSSIEATYRWLADGTKAGVKTPSGSAGYEYLGSLIYVRTSNVLTFESTGFGGGRIVKSGNTLAADYHLTDHLGSVRVVFADGGRVAARNDYYAFGKRVTNSLLPASADNLNRHLFNGKERQVVGLPDYLDYGARMYDGEIGRWMTPDPLAEKYYPVSPYVYTANNPVRFVDPDGMEIENLSLKNWMHQKAMIQRRIDRMQDRMYKMISKGRNESKTANFSDRISSLNGTLGTMGVMEASSQVYALGGQVAEGLGGLSYDHGTGVITIGYEGTANFVHEVTHGGQFESGDVAFSIEESGSLGQDVYDEVAAYGAQYAYDPASVSGLPSSSAVRSSADITTGWVQGITLANGDKPYAPGGSANTGLSPVNVNSTISVLMKAYPNIGSFRISPTMKLKDIGPMHYKR